MQHATPRRTRGRDLRPWLILIKFAALSAVFGGLGSLVAIGIRVDTPTDVAGWMLLKSVMRGIFWPCVFCGLVVTVLAGIALWLQHPKVFLGRRWFRLKATLLAVSLPSLHLFGRGRTLAFYDAIDAGALAALPELLARVTQAYALALVVLFAIAIIGRVKPRLGQWPKES